MLQCPGATLTPPTRASYVTVVLTTITAIHLGQIIISYFSKRINIPGVPKNRNPVFNFATTSVNVPAFNHFFTVKTRNPLRIQAKLRWTPHSYYVITLPSKTHTTAKIALYSFDLSMLKLFQQPQTKK